MTITIFSGTSGLNNIVDPTRLKLDYETGIVELAESSNILIDQTGRISRRLGSTKIANGSFHSMFCNGGDCFVVQDGVSTAAIFKVNTDKTLTGVRDSLTNGLRFGWWQLGAKTYYSSLAQNGIITDGISAPWTAQTYVGPETSRQFSGPPLGNHLAVFASRMFIVNGKYVWWSEPLGYGMYDLTRSYLRFGTDVLMFKPVNNGVFVSDSNRTYFLAGNDPKTFDRKKVLDCPAHEYSEIVGYVDGGDIGLAGAGQCAVWSCDEGLCVGTQNGEVVLITKNKLNYPAGTRGASLYYDSTIINTVE